jgi:TRAP-type C4-dicarboxylate transport system permease small subunit
MNDDAAPVRGRYPAALRIAFALYAAYVVYVLVAAFAQKTTGKPLPVRLGDVGEFLLVLVATIFFVAGVVRLEPDHGRRGALALLDENGERYAMLVFYVICCFVIVQEVLRRFVLNYSSAWAEEVARYAFIYLGYVGAAYAVKERAHIRFDIVIGRVPARARSMLYALAEIATIVFAVIAFWWSMHTIAQLLRFEGATPVLRVNKAWFEAAVPIGFALVVVRCLQALRRDLADFAAGRAPWAGKSMFEE